MGMLEDLFEKVIEGAGETAEEIRSRLFLEDASGTLGQVQRDSAVDGLQTVEQRAPNYEDPQNETARVEDRSHRSLVGEQTLSPAAGSSSAVNPSSNNVSDNSCDITIQNTGNEILWVTFDGTTDSGYQLKPDEDTGGEFYGHTSTDGDIVVRTDSNAGGAGEAQAIFQE